MTDDLREVLAESILAKPWGDGAYDDAFWASVRITGEEALHALRQVEQRAYERAAQACDSARIAFSREREKHSDMGDRESYHSGQANGAMQLATAIRALASPALIRDTKGEGLSSPPSSSPPQR